MRIFEIITYLSIIIWIFPALRHIKSEFSYYFILLAIVDPIKLVFFYSFNENVQLISIPFSLFLLYSVLEIEMSTIINFLLISIISIVSVVGYIFNYQYEIGQIADLLIMIILIKKMAERFFEDSTIDMIILFICFYELSLIFKSIPKLTHVSGMNYYFQLTTLLQLLFGIFFSFVEEWKIKLE